MQRAATPIRITDEALNSMVAYFCHHLSDNNFDLSDLYVVLSDLYVDLSELYVDLSDLYVDLSLIHLFENESYKRVLAIQIT